MISSGKNRKEPIQRHKKCAPAARCISFNLEKVYVSFSRHLPEQRRQKLGIGHLLVIFGSNLLNLVSSPDVRRLIRIRVLESFPLTHVQDGLSDRQSQQTSTENHSADDRDRHCRRSRRRRLKVHSEQSVPQRVDEDDEEARQIRGGGGGGGRSFGLVMNAVRSSGV